MRGRLQDECHNYIRVLVPRDAGTLLACGTNAFSPLCRTYQVSSLAQEGEEVSGQARCPFDAKQSIVALFVDGSLYSATVADFQASDAVIYRSLSPGRPPLRTLKYSSRWLQEPHFVQVLPYGPYVYFFFREVSVELSAMGKVLVARVARVCRNDRGGSPRVLERRWTSFLKVRLQCAVPGDTVFSFDVLEAVTPPRALHGRPAVLALFGTQPNRHDGGAGGHRDMGRWGQGQGSGQGAPTQVPPTPHPGAWAPPPPRVQRLPHGAPAGCAAGRAAALGWDRPPASPPPGTSLTRRCPSPRSTRCCTGPWHPRAGGPSSPAPAPGARWVLVGTGGGRCDATTGVRVRRGGSGRSFGWCRVGSALVQGCCARRHEAAGARGVQGRGGACEAPVRGCARPPCEQLQRARRVCCAQADPAGGGHGRGAVEEPDRALPGC
uniref:Semaphorin 6C n=1 Tax=Strigops habroptila TaxID=2489341 RepID=A0A672UKX2_STRHB